MPRRRPPTDISIPLAALTVSVATVATAQGISAIVIAAEGATDWWHQALGGGVLTLLAAIVLALTWFRLPVVASPHVARLLRLAVFLSAGGLVLNGVAAAVALH